MSRRPLKVRFTMTELFTECVMRLPGDSMLGPFVRQRTCGPTFRDDERNDFHSQCSGRKL